MHLTNQPLACAPRAVNVKQWPVQIVACPTTAPPPSHEKNRPEKCIRASPLFSPYLTPCPIHLFAQHGLHSSARSLPVFARPRPVKTEPIPCETCTGALSALCTGKCPRSARPVLHLALLLAQANRDRRGKRDRGLCAWTKRWVGVEMHRALSNADVKCQASNEGMTKRRLAVCVCSSILYHTSIHAIL